MAIETTCSGCGKQIAVADEFAGRQARCPACGQIYTVQAPGAAGPPDLPGPSNPLDSTPSLERDYSENLNDSARPSGDVEQFWMMAGDQTQYGPVDRSNLNRWFAEGRVGPDYQIRQGESGPWQPAEYFRPLVSPFSAAVPGESNNPYAATTQYSPAMAGLGVFPKPDQSTIVLVMGILGWVVCPIFGLVAWIMGHQGLKDIAQGRMDPQNIKMMQIGYYLGMVQTILSCICCGGYFVIVAISIIAN